MSETELTPERIAELLAPYVAAFPADAALPGPGICAQLATYLDLILKWNERINLTAIRQPEEIVRRHFGESLFAGAHLDSRGGECRTLLDFGSGAGFPGVPIQLLRPGVQVTLAESRNRKAAFLHEVVRTLGLTSEVWAARVEDMPPARQFDVVAMRAVDDMEAAVTEAAPRARSRIVILGTRDASYAEPGFLEASAPGFAAEEPVPLPETANGALIRLRPAAGSQ